MHPASVIIIGFLVLICVCVGVPLYFQGIPNVPIPLLILVGLILLGTLAGQLFPADDSPSKDLPGLWDNIEGEIYQHGDGQFSILTEQGNFLMQDKHGRYRVTEVDQNGRTGHWIHGSPKQLGEHIKYVVNKRKGHGNEPAS